MGKLKNLKHISSWALHLHSWHHHGEMAKLPEQQCTKVSWKEVVKGMPSFLNHRNGEGGFEKYPSTNLEVYTQWKYSSNQRKTKTFLSTEKLREFITGRFTLKVVKTVLQEWGKWFQTEKQKCRKERVNMWINLNKYTLCNAVIIPCAV